MIQADTIYFDLIGGASGDMLLGALVDAGLELDVLRQALASLGLPGWSLERERVTRRGIAATLLHVRVQDDATERHLDDLLQALAAGSLRPQVQTTCAAILTRLAEAEARIHQQPLSEVHLHEVGGLDTIVDVAGTVIGLDLLGVRHIVVAPFPLARGEIQTAHGRLPLPAPATLDLLRGAPIVGIEGERETVTPTAAAILTQVANAYGTLPRMTVEAVGYGAGRRDDPAPNVLRVIAGRGEPAGSALESIVELETNIDDMNPQWYEVLMTRLFDAGALDVTLTPMQMKKNRPAVSLRVLAPVELTAALRTIILNETTTLGVREHPVQRYTLPREIVPIETEFGVIRVKIARRPNNSRTASPEYDDCARAAREHRVPLAVVLETVERHAHALLAEEHNAGRQAPPTWKSPLLG